MRFEIQIRDLQANTTVDFDIYVINAGVQVSNIVVTVHI